MSICMNHNWRGFRFFFRFIKLWLENQIFCDRRRRRGGSMHWKSPGHPQQQASQRDTFPTGQTRAPSHSHPCETEWFKTWLGNYCWWKKSCTSWCSRYPSIHRVLYIPGGAGFFPSTVCKQNLHVFFGGVVHQANWKWYETDTIGEGCLRLVISGRLLKGSVVFVGNAERVGLEKLIASVRVHECINFVAFFFDDLLVGTLR